eukprot:1443274-Prymnesium_polylepis.1
MPGGRPPRKKDAKKRDDGRWKGKRKAAAPKAGVRPESQPTVTASFEGQRGQSSSGGTASGTGSSGDAHQQGGSSAGARAADPAPPEPEQSAGAAARDGAGHSEQQEGKADGEDRDDA